MISRGRDLALLYVDNHLPQRMGPYYRRTQLPWGWRVRSLKRRKYIDDFSDPIQQTISWLPRDYPWGLWGELSLAYGEWNSDGKSKMRPWGYRIRTSVSRHWRRIPWIPNHPPTL